MNEQGFGTTGPTVQEIFGLPQGCRAVLQRTMGDTVFQIVASKRPDVAIAIGALHGQTATVVTVNSDMVELRLDEPVTMGGVYENVTVQMARAVTGFFRVSLSGTGTPPLLHEVSDLTVTREGERFVLADSASRLRFTPSAGGVKLEVYTAPFLARESMMVRALAPALVDVFSLTVQENPPGE